MMSSIRALQVPTITFVGRPTDSRKGLQTLLDAVVLIDQQASVPSFDIWVIGGSEQEVTLLEKVCRRQRQLAMFMERGKLRLWGRIDHTTLAEFYSRSLVTVMPSLREEFGMVAVEAMMSGCPVVAARTGGLQNLIDRRVGGALFQPDDPVTLAAILLRYLRNTAFSDIEGSRVAKWARARFAAKEVFAELIKIYLCGAPSESNGTNWSFKSFLKPDSGDDVSSAVGWMLPGPIEAITRLSGQRHQMYYVASGGNTYIVKRHVDRASEQLALYPSLHVYPKVISAQLAGRKARFTGDCPSSAPLCRAQSDDECLLIMPMYQAHEGVNLKSCDKVIADLARTTRSWMSTIIRPERLREWRDVFQVHCSSPSWESLDKVDRAGVALQPEPLCSSFVRVHPCIELDRIRLHLLASSWPLNTATAVRFLAAVDAAHAIVPKSSGKVHFCHADPKLEHLVKTIDGVRLIDFEHAHFAVGPIDEVFWIRETIINGKQTEDARSALHRLQRMVETREDLEFACAWLVAEVIHASLLARQCGDTAPIGRSVVFLRDIPLLFAGMQFTR